MKSFPINIFFFFLATFKWLALGHTLTCRFLKVKKCRLVSGIYKDAHSQKDDRKGIDRSDFEVTR